MLLLGIDFETTGLNIETLSVTEVGVVLWDTDIHAPIKLAGFLVDPGPSAVWEESTEHTQAAVLVNGITSELCDKYGMPDDRALQQVYNWYQLADAIVAHNGTKFDRPVLQRWITRHQFSWEENKLWIDTKCDLGTPPHLSSRLNYMAADHKFLNPFEHRAVFDVMTTLMILDDYDLTKVIEVAKSPSLDVRALVDYDNREKAKTRGFHWESDVKQWKHTVKECHLERERESCKAAGFDIEVLNVV